MRTDAEIWRRACQRIETPAERTARLFAEAVAEMGLPPKISECIMQASHSNAGEPPNR